MWLRPKASLKAVGGIGEVEGIVGEIGDDVAGGVEGSAVEVVEYHARFVRPSDIYLHEPGRLFQGPLSADDDAGGIAIGVGGTPGGHITAFRASNFVSGEFAAGVELDLGDFRALVG